MYLKSASTLDRQSGYCDSFCAGSQPAHDVRTTLLRRHFTVWTFLRHVPPGGLD